MSKFAIIDERMSEKCKKSLENLGLKLIEVPQNSNLDKPISAHPDIYMFSQNKCVVAEEKTYNLLYGHLFDFPDSNYKVVCGSGFSEKTLYPYDCKYNFAVCGNFIIGNKTHIEPEIAKYADANKLDIINVKQGYSKCNICVVSDNAIITEDFGIAGECKKHGIDVLHLKTNSVRLDGYKNGFLGGATGVFYDNCGNKKILFAGNIEKHPEYSEIKMFCNKYGAELFSLSDEDLYDYGSIIVI